jgi:hypothetical protein
MKRLFHAYAEFMVEGLNHIARTLNGEYENAYWRGYYDGFQDFKSMRDEK